MGRLSFVDKLIWRAKFFYKVVKDKTLLTVSSYFWKLLFSSSRMIKEYFLNVLSTYFDSGCLNLPINYYNRRFELKLPETLIKQSILEFLDVLFPCIDKDSFLFKDPYVELIYHLSDVIREG